MAGETAFFRPLALSHGLQAWQHGESSHRTKQLRAMGDKVANVLADIDATTAVADPTCPDTDAQLLVEWFLIATDSGWILRNAQFYRSGEVKIYDDPTPRAYVGMPGKPRIPR